MKVAIIGLGNMGSGIARNILKAGYDLTIWNRTRSKMTPLLQLGAKGAASAAEAASGADLVISALMDDASIEQMLVGSGQVLRAMKPGAIHLCAATISPRFAAVLKKLHEENDTRYVSGPVLGRPDAAEEGSLVTLLAGDSDALEQVKQVSETYCAQVISLPGEPQSANVMKLGLNYMVAASIEAMSEAYALVEANGGDTGLMANILASQFYAHPAPKMYAQKIVQREFQGAAGFALTGGLKDIRLMIDAAREQGVDLDIAKAIEGKMIEAVNKGLGDKDWSAIYEITRSRAGLK